MVQYVNDKFGEVLPRIDELERRASRKAHIFGMTPARPEEQKDEKIKRRSSMTQKVGGAKCLKETEGRSTESSTTKPKQDRRRQEGNKKT